MDNKSAELYVALKHAQNGSQAITSTAEKLIKEVNAARLSMSVAIVAAEKQIPYKPPVIYKGSGHPAYECKCGHILPTRTAKYCDECGQRLEYDRRETK